MKPFATLGSEIGKVRDRVRRGAESLRPSRVALDVKDQRDRLLAKLGEQTFRLIAERKLAVPKVLQEPVERLAALLGVQLPPWPSEPPPPNEPQAAQPSPPPAAPSVEEAQARASEPLAQDPLPTPEPGPVAEAEPEAEAAPAAEPAPAPAAEAAPAVEPEPAPVAEPEAEAAPVAEAAPAPAPASDVPPPAPPRGARARRRRERAGRVPDVDARLDRAVRGADATREKLREKCEIDRASRKVVAKGWEAR